MTTPRVLQPQHYEYRYLIPAGVGETLRDFVAQYLDLDEHGVGRPNYSYPVHDYYLDSSQWKIYWRTIDVAARNPMLRFRTYSKNPSGPIYMEIKRHQHDMVEKQSIPIPREAIPSVLSGHLPDLAEAPDGKGGRFDLERFCQLVTKNHARPRVHVAFGREAWVSGERADQRVRVTLDRNIQCQLLQEAELTSEMARPIRMHEKKIVLELKFAERFPDWFRDLSQ